MSEVIHKINANRVVFRCPGCKMNHQLNINVDSGSPVWYWNSDKVKPTFTPSILATWKEPSDDPLLFGDPTHDINKVCHSFVTDGKIQFLNDCTHGFAGMTIDLIPWRED